MPGFVSVKTPPDTPSLRISVPDTPPVSNHRTPSPLTNKQPSPSSSRSTNGKKKLQPESPTATQCPPDSSLDNPDLGPFLLKLARDTIASGDGPNKALDYAIRASKSFERCAVDGEPSLDLAMSLHVLAAIYCSLGRFEEAVPVLEQAIQVPDIGRGTDHALAAFSGHMQLGDTYSMVGQIERSIGCYEEGLKIQIEALGETDPRVGETCRAEELCKKTLEIHHAHSEPASLEEAADRRLMALICEAKGDYEQALEHLVLASMAMVANGQDSEVAAIDVSIGNIYMSLARFDEAVFSYQKALTVFKASKGDNHPLVASVFIRLADLYHRTGKLRESRSYCENAMRIYSKPVPGTSPEEIAGGLTGVSAIYESVGEAEEALKLLQKAMKMLEDKPGQQSTIAGIEARMGVMFYMVGRYEDARIAFESAISKLRATGERKSAFFGVVLNQMGLACVQLFKIDEAVELFEEARGILEQECGNCHQDTIGLREEKLGIANPDFEDEKRRLAALLKEAGRTRNRKAKSLENLIDPNSRKTKKETTKKWSSLGFRI
ncbi:Protein KINESIN LIGHT CHAIN-RELATED 1 [Cucurbita argyrosperma subsp. argyrosperma]|nr:Protein KINESIN LIGHT CHAIN-RELATED 1 [Cucurbita argyrosperma subsp. argyrosperma]